jgi:predicted regulator of Ras-like GTPase activity (Roadblock/LC7/MglB family)
MALRWLSALEGTPHLVTAVLVSDDGLEIESIGETDQIQMLAAETASIVRVATASGLSLGAQRLFRFSMTTDQFELITIRAGTTYSLTVVAQRGADLRGIQVEMARLALQLVQELS